MLEKKIRKYLGENSNLPHGCRLYCLSLLGKIFVAENGKVAEVKKGSKEFDELIHMFINSGNNAHYLIGSPDTSQQNPSNATVKMIMMEPHNHFIPHSHGTEHFIFCQGYSGCLLYDVKSKKVVVVKLKPGTLIYLSPMVPHAFFNRSDSQFIGLVSNTGLGINSEEYAITTEKISKMLLTETDENQKNKLIDINNQLVNIEEFYKDFNIPGSLELHEKVARKLYRIAELVSW